MNCPALSPLLRRVFAAALVLPLATSTSLTARVSAQEPAAALAATDREGALNAAADARVAALVAGDVAALGAILSDDLHYVHSSGVIDTKESFLSNLSSGVIDYLEYEQGARSWRYPVPGLAIESGFARLKVRNANGVERVDVSYLANWREEGGQWRFLVWKSGRLPQPGIPAGFTALFDGESLSGWRGRPHFDPAAEAALAPEERAAKQAEWDADMRQHWKVEGGEIVSDGHGVFLTTDHDYGDFELHLEWMLPESCADSGIYLRGNPQVQIWDPDCERDFQHGNQKGSGGLWNNPADSPGKWPLERADSPTGAWNTTRVRMQGEHVTVILNDRIVVDDARLANFFAAGTPLPEKGPIQIQTHGAPMRVRNVAIRELSTLEGTGPGWRDLTGAEFENVNGEPDTWTWKDGGVHCTGRPVGVIKTKQPVKNLEMSLEWRHLTKGGNSGVFLWAPATVLENLKPGALPPGGIEVQVLDHGYAEEYERSTGKKSDWFTTDGDVFPVGSSDMTPFPPVAPGGKRSFPTASHSRGSPEWNHYYIRAIDGEVRLWVNGHEVSGGTECKPAEGFLCLESEGAPVEFRRLRIRHLP